MIKIGLLGGCGSGKSSVAAMFKEFSFLHPVVIDGDAITHTMLDKPEIQAQVEKAFGCLVIENGKVNRRYLASIVFDPNNIWYLKRLEEIVNPKSAIKKAVDDAEESGAELCILDVPLLLEMGLDEICDSLVFIDTPYQVRLQNCLDRGWMETELNRRESNQLPLASKATRANAIFDGAFNHKKAEVYLYLAQLFVDVDDLFEANSVVRLFTRHLMTLQSTTGNITSHDLWIGEQLIKLLLEYNDPHSKEFENLAAVLDKSDDQKQNRHMQFD